MPFNKESSCNVHAKSITVFGALNLDPIETQLEYN
jgi:hypothetical protein